MINVSLNKYTYGISRNRCSSLKARRSPFFVWAVLDPTCQDLVDPSYFPPFMSVSIPDMISSCRLRVCTTLDALRRPAMFCLSMWKFASNDRTKYSVFPLPHSPGQLGYAA